MSTNLLGPIRNLRTTLRRLAITRGTALAVTLLLGLVIVAGTVDWVLHIDDHGTRLLLGISICVAVAAAMWRWIVQPCLSRMSDLQIAQRIEAVHPELEGRLSSSVDFVSQPTPGSVELTKTTVASATHSVSDLQIEQLPDRRPMMEAIVAAGVLAIVVAALFFAKPVEAQIAVQRLWSPFQDIPWPRSTDFRVIGEDADTLPDNVPLTVVQGEYRELLVENTKGELPPDAAIEYRLGRDGKSRFESLQPIRLGARTAGEVGRAVLAPGKSPVYLRATGGDHQTAWYRLDVVSPSKIEVIGITIEHPDYTGRDDQTLPRGLTTIEALIGSTVRVRAKSGKPLKSATVSLFGQKLDAQLDASGTRLSASLELDREGISSWWIDVLDRDGIENPRPPRYELRVVKDSSPSVFIEVPGGDIQVTRQAKVAVRVVASDDLAISSLTLNRYTGSLEGDANDLLLEREPGDSEAAVNATAQLTIAELGISEGDRVLLQAVASDAYHGYDGELSHVVASDPRTLIVVSSETKQAELARVQAGLIDELTRVADSQTRTRDSVSDLRIQQRETESLRRADLDLLKRTEIDQHRIASTLFDDLDGLSVRMQRLVDQFDANGIEATESRSQLSSVLGELQHVRDNVMPEVQSGVTDVRKVVENAMNEQSENVAVLPDADQRLQAIESRQNEIIESLESVLDGAESWRQRVDLQTALAKIASQQSELSRESAALAERSLKAESQDKRQQAADAARLARRQGRLADELDDLVNQLAQVIAELDQSDPALTSRLRAGTDFVKQNGPSLKMREAASELTAGRTGAAGSLQAAVSDDLRRLSELLDTPLSTPYETLVENLDEVEAELNDLIQQQDAIAKGIRSGQPDVADRQAEIRTRTERQQRALSRSGSSDAANEVGLAVQEMKNTEQAVRENEQAAGAESADAAGSALRKALESTVQQRKQLQRQSAIDDLFAAIGQLKEIAAAQQQVLGRTQDLEAARQQSGRRTRQQSRDILKLGIEQGTLSEQVLTAAAALGSSPVVALVLESAADHMQQAQSRLSKRDTTADTTALQQLAIAELSEVMAAVLPNDDQEPAADGVEPEDQDATGQPPPEEQLVSIQARLKLLRSLQRTVNRRTETLNTQSEEAADAVESDRLAKRQQQIAELAARLLSEFTGEPNE